MDLDRELERLSREAREKNDRERAAQEAALKAAGDEAREASERMREESRAGQGEDDEDDAVGKAPLGMQVLAGIGLLVVVVIVWKLVVAPLLAAAITLGAIALVVWVVLKLAGFGAKT